MLLPGANLSAVVFICKNQVGLDPGDSLAGKDQQIPDPLGIQAAILVQLLTAFEGDGFNAALHGNAVGVSQQVQRLLIPKINPGLDADLDGTPGNFLEQPAHIVPNTKNLINEVDVLHTTRYQGINLLHQGFNATLAKLIAEKGLVTERASPGTATRKLQLCANPLVLGKHVMAVPVGLDIVVVEIQRPQSFHVGNAQFQAYMDTSLSTKTAARNLTPGFIGQL